MSKKILVSSEKENIGKSLVGVRMARELSRTNGKVVIVEYSDKNKSISEYLEVDDSIIYDLRDTLDGICDFEQCIINIAENIDLLPAPRLKEKLFGVETTSFSNLIANLEKVYDNIIIEVSSLSKCYSIDIHNMNTIIMINNNEFSSIKEINDEFIIATENNIKNKYILVNKYDEKGAKKFNKLSIKDYTKIFPEPLLVFVRYDDRYESLKSDYFLNTYNDELSLTIQKISKNS